MAQDAPETPQEKKAVDLVAHLPEVVRFNKYFIKKFGRPLIMAIDKDPTAANPFYTVAIEEDMVDHYFTYWWFCVNEKTKAISYYDVINDKKVPLEVWRKSGRKP